MLCVFSLTLEILWGIREHPCECKADRRGRREGRRQNLRTQERKHNFVVKWATGPTNSTWAKSNCTSSKTNHLSCSKMTITFFKQLERIRRIIIRDLLGRVQISAKNPAMPVYHGGGKGHRAHFQFIYALKFFPG